MKKKNTPVRAKIPPVEVDPARGLNETQVRQRVSGGWTNAQPESAGPSARTIILRNCFTCFNLIFLVIATLLVVAAYPFRDAGFLKNLTFLIVVITNTVIGSVQELRAKRAVDELTLMAAQTVPVMRDGALTQVRSDLLVRDDIILLSPGDQICADAVVCSGELQVNEALITGEADPVEKKPGAQLRSGSFVITGRGFARLTRVGGDSYAAQLSAQAKANPHAAKSEMMRSLDRLIRVVGILLVPIGLILFYQEYRVLELSFQTSVQSTAAALIGMIPEGLYLLTSIAMAASAIKLSRQKVLVRDMNCIETLARVDVLCVDKTGTITEPHMEVCDVIPLKAQDPDRLEAILAALCSQVPENDTARAMAELFAEPSDWVCTRRIPFSSAFKWSCAEFEGQGTYLTGAPECVLGDRYSEIRDQVEPWADEGCRVLLLAAYQSYPAPGALDGTQVEPLALIVLSNPIRAGAPATFAYFAEQGVGVRVISGDNPRTVAEVARRAGIAGTDAWIDANELETPEDFDRAVAEKTVFGRVTPDKKRELVRAFRRAGHTVAMTGDGVNDVLAMKEADCGIAMASGAQAASQIAQLVLLESDFAAMPHIVGEGRRVINNIQRAATLFLVKNIFSLALSVITLFTNWQYPIVPLHLSVISGLTIGIPSFFLAMEPNYERVRGRFLAGVLRRAFPGGLANIFVVLAAQAYMAVFLLPMEQISTICAALLSFVGLLVLYQVCKPFDRFRRLIWAAMAAGLVICFTALGSFLELRTGSTATALVMATLLIMTPTVFFVMQRLFDWGDRVYAAVIAWRGKRTRDADL